MLWSGKARGVALSLQRAVWAAKKPGAGRWKRAPICRLLAFSDCCAICGPLRGPAQTWMGCLPNEVATVALKRSRLRPWHASTKLRRGIIILRCNLRFGNDGVSLQMALQRHSLKTETARIELAQIRAAFRFRRISEALFAARLFHHLAETQRIAKSSNIAS